MKLSPKAAQFSLAILMGLVAGGSSLWLLSGTERRRFEALKAGALCVVDLRAGATNLSTTLTNSRSIDMFHLALRTASRDDAFSISITGERGLVASVSQVKASSFGLGKDIPPGNYTVTVRQAIGTKGGSVAIADAPPVYVTGWQIWSRAYLGLLAVSAICWILLRKAENSKIRSSSIAAFHTLLLGGSVMFVYLLFHEGGHALAQIAFGHFDLARSDFWGIHGHPHSGATMGPQLAPWQHALISCGGPMLPTLAGFALFGLWFAPFGQRLRHAHPLANLYFSANVAGLVFAEAVCGPAYLLGLITAEGDLLRFAASEGVPVWPIKVALCGIFLLCAWILWRVTPEIRRAWIRSFSSPVSGGREAAPIPPNDTADATGTR
jgi:hypothetical protein